MSEALGGLFLLLAVLAPIAAFVHQTRQASFSIRHLLIAPTVAGLAIGLLFWVTIVSMDARLLTHPAYLPWIGIFASWGTVIGIVGVVARFLGGWRPGA